MLAELPSLPAAADRAARERYLRAHAPVMYDRLTDGKKTFVRVDELCRRAAERFPALLPGAMVISGSG